jgi:hypothetical protein
MLQAHVQKGPNCSWVCVCGVRLNDERQSLVTTNLVASANAGKKSTKAVQDVKEAQKKATNSESSSFAIVYNNFFFLFTFFLIGFYFFPHFPAPFGYAFSVIGGSSLVAFVSHQALKR